jgi:probable phosphoglycerate mutase
LITAFQKDAMTLLYLVRHGETDWNFERRIQGNTDIPLNDTGREQARRTGKLLARRSWDAIVASPLSRAFETATIIAEELGLPEPTTLDAIVERDYGAAEGLTDTELNRLYPGDTFVPNRESRESVVARVIPALLDLAENHQGQSLLVVSHGGVIRSVLNAIQPDHWHGSIRNGSVHSFRHTDGTLELITFDDPIDVESLQPDAEELEQQNAVERRETAQGAN